MTGPKRASRSAAPKAGSAAASAAKSSADAASDATAGEVTAASEAPVPEATVATPATSEAPVIAAPAAAQPEPPSMATAAEVGPAEAPAAAPAPTAAAPAPTAAAPAPTAAAPAEAPAAAPAPTAAAPAPTAAAPAPTAAAPAATAAAPEPPASPAPPAAPTGPSFLERLRTSVGRVTDHLSRGELLASVGAAIILVVTFLFFGVLLGQFLLGTASEVTLLLSIGVLGVVSLQASGRHDFGHPYRTWLAVLTGAIAILAILSAVELLRLAFNGQSNEQWLTRLSYWIGAAITGVGGFLVWRERS